MILNHLNRLQNESSAYLLQHASNPVHWYPWSEEALSAAIKEDKPILLSIGYSACHWCHVMEKESFEDSTTANLINENFIAIKVDREERPDIDDIYMSAVQLMTGHGGWPLTVFLTPQLKPFYGGTYFPKENRQYRQQIMPGFQTVLKAVNKSWTAQRTEIENSAENITTTINSLNMQIEDDQLQEVLPANNELIIESGLHLLDYFDKQWGGFGRAPKFPQALCLSLCLRLAFKLKNAGDSRSELFLKALDTSLNHMANGGIYDHLGGGFARYATDAKWLIPHFEKMLYDNALLAQLYLEAFAFTGKRHWLEVGCQTLDFIERDLGDANGAFYSSLDADSEGEEGKFYLWQKAEITKILGTDSSLFCHVFSVTEEGNFESDKNILYRNSNDLDNFKSEQIVQKLNEMKAKLFTFRSSRTYPGLDKKILTSWNGLAISAFVSGYKASGEEKYLQTAKKAAQFILANLSFKNKLKHCYAGKQAKFPAYLDDYAFFVQALIDLAGVDSNPIWLEKALDFTESILQHFYDHKFADFFYTAADQEKLIVRTKNNNDGPTPSATSVAVINLIKLSAITGNESYREYAKTIADKYKQSFLRKPSQYANMIAAWDAAQGWPMLFVVISSGNNVLDNAMTKVLHNLYTPDKLVIIKESPNSLTDKISDKVIDSHIKIFADKPIVNNQPTVYLCNEYGCQPPVNNPDSLRKILSEYIKIPLC